MKPDIIHHTGTLTSDNMRHEVRIPVQVPEDVTHIHFVFTHSPHKAEGQKRRHQISVTIFDPHGPRIEVSHPDEHGVFVGEAGASPGGTPGPVPAGQWTVIILVHRLLSDEPVHYDLDISMSFDPVEQKAPILEPAQVASRGPGWYRGDLHAHTHHSDGSWQAADLIQFWKDMDLDVDFMTLSDHNTITGLPKLRSLASDDLLTLGAIELSTFFGHAVAAGVDRWFDWRTPDGQMLSMPELAQQVIDSGALFIIAHPKDPGDPGCCGCRWEYEDMMPGNAQAVEIWNGPWAPRNQEALQLFYTWLNRGHRLTATSGTDLHGPPPPNVRGAVNVVYAQELSEKAIVQALKTGRSYVSAGPELTLTVKTASGAEGMIGDTLPAEVAAVTIRWNEGHDGDSLYFVIDGKVYRAKTVGPSGEQTWQIKAGQARWCTAELRDSKDNLWAVTNPIFFG